MNWPNRLCCPQHPCMINGEVFYMCQHSAPPRPMDLFGNYAFGINPKLTEIYPVHTNRWGFIPAYTREN